MKVIKKKVISLVKLKKEAWRLFSIHIRKSEADWRGYVSCICCGETYMWDSGKIHAGHWIHDKLDYDERNVHPQCYKCNLNFNWKKATALYAIYMARTYGAEEMAKIKADSIEKGNNYTRTELTEIISKYQTQTKSV